MAGLLVAWALLAAPPAVADKRAELEARLQSGEVVIDTKAVRGSDVPLVTALAVVDAPPEEVWAIVSSCKRLQEVLEDGSVAELQWKKGSRSRCRVVVSMPFPFSDLESITDVKQTVTPGRWKSAWKRGGGDFEVNEGHWILAPQGKGTLVVYAVRAKPNLAIPKKILVQTQRSRMVGILKKLRDVLAPGGVAGK